MESFREERPVSRRAFGRAVAAGVGLAGASAALRADDQNAPPPPRRRGAFHEDGRDGGHGGPGVYSDVAELPFHLQHEFMHAVSCNNAVARAEEADFGGKDAHAILQRPGTFGWGTITFFLRLDPRLVGREMSFFSTVGWSGRAEGDVMFSVEINGDVVIDGARSAKNGWMEVERTLPVKAAEMRVTLMVDSIAGDNEFSFWWGEPQLRAAQPGRGGDHEHHEHEDAGRQPPTGRPRREGPEHEHEDAPPRR